MARAKKTQGSTRLFTEAEIYEAVCWAVGDDGFCAEEVLRIINSERNNYGIMNNEEYAKNRKDFAQVKVSDNDKCFGFYKRPTKVEVI
tara:strand:+ start:300 stop:563 length:264 start_codon:yes stop_codon:yes gene_type:complete